MKACGLSSSIISDHCHHINFLHIGRSSVENSKSHFNSVSPQIPRTHSLTLACWATCRASRAIFFASLIFFAQYLFIAQCSPYIYFRSADKSRTSWNSVKMVVFSGWNRVCICWRLIAAAADVYAWYNCQNLLWWSEGCSVSIILVWPHFGPPHSDENWGMIRSRPGRVSPEAQRKAQPYRGRVKNRAVLNTYNARRFYTLLRYGCASDHTSSGRKRIVPGSWGRGIRWRRSLKNGTDVAFETESHREPELGSRAWAIKSSLLKNQIYCINSVHWIVTHFSVGNTRQHWWGMRVCVLRQRCIHSKENRRPSWFIVSNIQNIYTFVCDVVRPHDRSTIVSLTQYTT